jgi:hypothetical protein
LFILLSLGLYANNGGVAIIGGSLHPINITNVFMDYERLNITCKDGEFEVEVYIELFNHEKITIEPQPGFEFSEGRMGYYDVIKNSKNYILLVNNEVQRFEYKVIQSPAYLRSCVNIQAKTGAGEKFSLS